MIYEKKFIDSLGPKGLYFDLALCLRDHSKYCTDVMASKNTKLLCLNKQIFKNFFGKYLISRSLNICQING